jgi:hypothetical protein
VHPLYISSLVNNTNLHNENIKNIQIYACVCVCVCVCDIKILMEFLGCTHHRFLDYIHHNIILWTLQLLVEMHMITAYDFND